MLLPLDRYSVVADPPAPIEHSICLCTELRVQLRTIPAQYQLLAKVRDDMV